LKLSTENCSQTAADRNVITINSLWKVAAPYPKIPSLTFYDLPFSHNYTAHCVVYCFAFGSS